MKMGVLNMEKEEKEKEIEAKEKEQPQEVPCILEVVDIEELAVDGICGIY